MPLKLGQDFRDKAWPTLRSALACAAACGAAAVRGTKRAQKRSAVRRQVYKVRVALAWLGKDSVFTYVIGIGRLGFRHPSRTAAQLGDVDNQCMSGPRLVML